MRAAKRLHLGRAKGLSNAKTRARAEWRQYWPLVIAASLAFSFTSVMTAAAGLFMEPLGKEFGWSRTLLSSGTSIAAVTTFFLSPLFGLFIDRIGVRRLALPGLALMALTIASLSLLNGAVWLWFAIWTVYAAAALATKSTCGQHRWPAPSMPGAASPWGWCSRAARWRRGSPRR
jgi:MFS family permease